MAKQRERTVAARLERRRMTLAALGVIAVAALLPACSAPSTGAVVQRRSAGGLVVPGAHFGVSDPYGPEVGRHDARLGVRHGDAAPAGYESVVTRTHDQRRTTNGRVRETSRTTVRSTRTTILPR